MYSYSRHRRNQHPTFHGHTLRVRNKGGDAPPELHKAREQVLSACERAGSLFVHWRRFTPEFNNNQRCPNYSPITKTHNNANCEICYGTTFVGGYARPVIQYMISQHSNRRLEATASGFVRLNENRSQSPYLPNINVGDILGELKNMEGDLVVDDRYIIESGVDKLRFRLADNFSTPNTLDHLDPESDVYGYEFSSTRIPKHTSPDRRDIKYSIPFENPVWLADRTKLDI